MVARLHTYAHIRVFLFFIKQCKEGKKIVKKSLKTRLTAFIIIIAIVPLIVMGLIVQYIQKDAMTSEIRDKASTIVSNLDDNINLFIDQNKNLVSFLATTKTIRSMDREQIVPFLYDMAQQNPQVLRIHIATLDGDFYSVPYTTTEEDYDVTGEDWFTGALDKQSLYITKVKKDPTTGNTIITISNPILSNTGTSAGVVSADISLVNLTKIAMNLKVGKKGYAFITDNHGVVIAHKDFKVVKSNKDFSDQNFVKEALKGKSGFAQYKDEKGAERFIAYAPQKSTGWGIFVQQPVDEAFANVKNTNITIYITTAIMILICLGAGMLVSNKISKPISQLAKLTHNVSLGDLTVDVKIKDSTEIGLLAKDFNNMISALKKLILQVMTATEELSASAEELASGSEQTSESAQQVSQAIEQIAMGANEQAKRLEDISELINNLFESNNKVEENSQLTAKSSQEMAKNARADLNRVNIATQKMAHIKSSVDNTNTIVTELDAKVGEIGNISNIIQEIVDQTNLLALNASIEAARAGEYGQGFAVVADEVRKLAEQSGDAARNIADIVKLIQKSSKTAVDAMAQSNKQVDEGQELILEIEKNLEHLMEQVNTVTEYSKRISQEIGNQNEDMGQIIDMVQNISSISQETAAGTEEVSASSEEQTATMESISASSQELAKLAENLQSNVNQFKI